MNTFIITVNFIGGLYFLTKSMKTGNLVTLALNGSLLLIASSVFFSAY